MSLIARRREKHLRDYINGMGSGSDGSGGGGSAEAAGAAARPAGDGADSPVRRAGAKRHQRPDADAEAAAAAAAPGGKKARHEQQLAAAAAAAQQQQPQQAPAGAAGRAPRAAQQATARTAVLTGVAALETVLAAAPVVSGGLYGGGWAGGRQLDLASPAGGGASDPDPAPQPAWLPWPTLGTWWLRQRPPRPAGAGG
jgi:hypothetical protein